MRPDESHVVEAVSAENIRKHVDHICTEIPSRLAGSPNGKRMAEYSAAQLREAGVEAKLEELPALVSFPEATEVRVTAPKSYAIAGHTLGHSVPGEVSGELVYVGPGGFKNYEGKDVAGKIVLTELSYSPARHEKQRIAALKGAKGAIMMNWGRPTDTAIPFGSVKPAWGNPTRETMRHEMPRIPCVGIARKAGLELKALCEQGSTRVSFDAKVQNGWRPVHLTFGEIRPGGRGGFPSVIRPTISDHAGRADDDGESAADFVVVGGHQDSWFGEASTDNAAGNACMMELARVFNAQRDKLKRGIVFGFWTAHETGTMSGSTWFVDRHWDRLREHAVAYLLIDQPACVGTTRWGTASNYELKRFHQSIEQRMLGSVPYFWKRMHKGGDASLFGMGVPMLYGMGAFTEKELHDTADANLGWWHHSIECTRDKVDYEWMAQHIGIYAAYLWTLCTSEVLPFEYSTVADEFEKRLTELNALGAAREVGLESALTAAADFKSAAAQLDRVADDWRWRYDTREGVDEAPARKLNEAFKRMSRILIPLQSTMRGTYGHDPYGFTPQSTMIPCLFDLAELEKTRPATEERWMLETQLVRERNRVVDGLNDARKVAREVVKALA